MTSGRVAAGLYVFRAYTASAVKLHDFVRVAGEVERFMLQDIQGLKLRTLISTHLKDEMNPERV